MRGRRNSHKNAILTLKIRSGFGDKNHIFQSTADAPDARLGTVRRHDAARFLAGHRHRIALDSYAVCLLRS
jgi:hypothetical protein